MDDTNKDDLADIGSKNLDAWRASGVVKTVKYYSAEDDDVCAECKKRHGSIIGIDDAKMGVNLPPLDVCSGKRCRCYFRPWDICTE
jgi:SPP1 gp7 family putative phage head morphogenesis protein